MNEMRKCPKCRVNLRLKPRIYCWRCGTTYRLIKHPIKDEEGFETGDRDVGILEEVI